MATSDTTLMGREHGIPVGLTQIPWLDRQWTAVVAGALTGLAVAVVMATLGSAIGLSAGTAMIDSPPADGSDVAVGFGVGAATWLLLSAIVVGLVGGTVLARTSDLGRPFRAAMLSLLTWAGGMLLGAVIGSSASAGVLAPLAAGGAGVHAQARANDAELAPADARGSAGVRDEALERRRAERRQIAKDAAASMTAAAWALLGAQLLGLGATWFGARWQRQRAEQQVVVERP